MRRTLTMAATLAAFMLSACGSDDSSDSSSDNQEDSAEEVMNASEPEDTPDSAVVLDADRTVEYLEEIFPHVADSEIDEMCAGVAEVGSQSLLASGLKLDTEAEYPDYLDFDAMAGYLIEMCAQLGEEDEADEEVERGTRENPWPITTELNTDEWELQLGVPYEAFADVKSRYERADDPGEGMEYWIVPIDAKYVGEGSARPSSAFRLQFVSDEDNHTYNDWCPLWPDSITEVNEVYAGAEVSGNFCIEVPEDAPGLWTLQVNRSDPAFLKVE